MEDYGERVKKLFSSQGFEIKDLTEDFEDFGVFKAVKQDEVLVLAYTEKEEGVENVLEVFSEKDIDGKKVLFLRSGSESLEAKAKDENIAISFFDPYKEEDRPEKPENMPSSYEILGDVAVLTLEEGQIGDKKGIAEYLMYQNPNVNTVLNKVEQLSGESRVGGYEKIVGDRTETIHKEHGAKLKLDPTKTFFSERLSHERQRVVDKVSDGEVVHAWFAGVGPYPIITALERSPETVYAIEKNPDACRYLKENVKLNKVEDVVKPFCGDVREIVPELEKADRIIMPLPKGSKNFLELAFNAVKENGVIHYYRFASEEERWENIEREVEKVAERKERDFEVIGRELCGHYAPYVHRVCLDIRIY